MSYVDYADIDAFDSYTGHEEWHSVYTIQLSQLIESGIFDWSNDSLAWADSAYDEEQYDRVCTGFIQRFLYREISITPFSIWAQRVRYKLAYELMPKYLPLYEATAQGFNALADSDEFFKRRTIDSDYPETLLSGNADYISAGTDSEEERIRLANVSEQIASYAENYRSIDQMILDELECMFVSMYTANVNGW